MKQEKVLPGDDVEIEITLTDEDGVGIPLGDLAGLTVEFCSDYGKRVHSTAPTAEEKDIALTDAPNGVFSLVLDRDFTAKYAGKVFDCDITVSFDETGNAAFTDGKRNRSIYWKEYIKIEEQC